ncbi:MAG: EcoRII N-terminal effector-binding domain-containing protein [Endozoicomonas sp.]|uniref:EcoRII N-terminal effector-binding domain-containing protein n=1 Tax=Endozoicomonas sp. TaxID=1892382 RepID=UPI003D9BF7C7
MKTSYEKILTKNDTGETGGHQAGVVVPKKNKKLLDFFPLLDDAQFNPDAWIVCIDPDGVEWEMRYIYYNGKTFSPPKSTRNEYRITHMTKLFSKWGAKSGDSVVFTSTDEPNIFEIRIKPCKEIIAESKTFDEHKPVVLKGWRPVF